MRVSFLSGPEKGLLFRNNCSASPRQFYILLLPMALPLLVGSVVLMVVGAPFVLVFAGLEVFALVLAFFIYAKHASDCERVTLCDHTLKVEVEYGGKKTVASFNRFTVRLSAPGTRSALIDVVGDGQHIQLGRLLPYRKRVALALALRKAVRGHDREDALTNAWLKASA